MKVKCIHITPKEAFKGYDMPLGISEQSQDFSLEINQEYLVMGIILGEGEISYLIDDKGIPWLYPFQLFKLVDNKLPSSWYFKQYTKDDDLYPYAEATWGYYELCFDDTHYEKLVERDEEAMRIYFRRKIALEKELAE